jgi:hypothetical protein
MRAKRVGEVLHQLAWVLAGAILGFGLAAVFSGTLHLRREVFLLPYLAVTAAFLEAYRRLNGPRAREALRQRWIGGLVGALVAGTFVVWSVLRQPASPAPQGAALLGSIAWLGVAYGTIDGLLLSVLPVAAMLRATESAAWALRPSGRAVAVLLALLASVAVTAAYHLGYPEFRGPGLAGPIIGCGVMSLAYLVTRNPLAAILSHVAMHVAAVLHGIDTTVQLPPHA